MGSFYAGLVLFMLILLFFVINYLHLLFSSLSLYCETNEQHFMPFKTDKLKLNDPFLDRRCKLIPCKKEMVMYWYGQGLSIRKIAKMFQVDKRLVQFTIFPERHQLNLNHRKDRGGSKVYYEGGENWATTIREHRRYKYNTLKSTV